MARRPKNKHAIKDLPPDYQAEIKGRRKRKRHQQEHRLNPSLPTLTIDTEIHCTEVEALFVDWFEACSQYAIAIDEVARERLKDKQAYNHYLQQFDEALDELLKYSTDTLSLMETRSNASYTTNEDPWRHSVKLAGPRGRQLLDAFKNADMALRYLQFMLIMGDISENESNGIKNGIRKTFNRLVRAMKKVKRDCFRNIGRAASSHIVKSKKLTQLEGELEDDADPKPRSVTRTRTAKSGDSPEESSEPSDASSGGDDQVSDDAPQVSDETVAAE